MPAKKARRFSKQNREIIRRNYNKKIIQLNRLIYELSFYSSEVNLQREFIQDFFNKQIDYAISVYRNQVKKLQDSSVDDYNFIVERTERFYQRKYQKLAEDESNNYSKILEEISLFEKNSINEKCNGLQKLIDELNQQILNEQEKFDEETKKWQKIISKKINEENLKGQKIIEDYLLESEEKYNRYQLDSDEKLKILQKSHDEELEKIKNVKIKNDIHIDAKYEQVNSEQYKDIVKMLQDQYKTKLSEIKDQIFNEINNIKKEDDFHQRKYKEHEEYILNQITEMEKFIDDLNSQFNSMKDHHNSEIVNLKSELDQLKSQNKDYLDEKSRLINQNSKNDESSIDYLINSLKSKIQLFQQKINIEIKNKNLAIESITQELDKCNKDMINQISELTQEMNSQKIQHKQEIESYQNDFISEKEKMTNLYKEKIDKISSNILLLKNNKEHVKDEYKSVINNLQNEKDFLISSNEKELFEFDAETEKTINQITNDYDLNRKSYQDQINDTISKDKYYYSNKIAEIEKHNHEKIENFKKEKENEYQKEIELLMKNGYSKIEYETIEKSYQAEYENLQNALISSSVLAPESDTFKNMARVISDLQSELKDHEVIIQSRGRCLNFEWKEKIRKENERFEKSPFNDKFLSNPRARDQMKKSYQSKINNVIKEKNEALTKLNSFVQKINSNSNINDEIKHLQNVLDQLDKQKNDLVQQALLKKEEMIKCKKEQIDQIQSEYNHIKREMLNKINDQKIDFNSNYKKLNDSLLSSQKIHNQDEQKENVSFQSKLNAISFQFCEKKCQLLGEINELSGRFSSSSLSSSISSSSSSSSLITQETKDAWTKQRKDFDAQVQCLRDQISSELSKLNSQKEEIIKNYDKILKDKLDRKMKLMKIMSNWSQRSSDADHINKLESNLNSVTIQLTNSINEMKKYKNLYVEQEIQINKKFGGATDVGLLQ